MCGLVGVLSYKNQVKENDKFINWALSTMYRRGPDSSNIWTNKISYITGFNRLSIRDLSVEANQPMVSDCGNYIISFNGEIYNTSYHKNKLINKDVKFRTKSDTEILLNGLIHFGLRNVLNQFDGIFAFSFYNKKENSLILARDRSGVKPLYYGHSESGLVFSSQYDHIINHPYIRGNSLDSKAIKSYLQFGYMIEGDDGIFTNTSFLPHGHYLRASNSKISIKKYWEYPLDISPKTDISLEEVISEATREQLVSDVPLGTFMSGGIDSTLVTNFAGIHSNQIKSYNIGIHDQDFDESKASNVFASFFETDHKNKVITKNDFIELVNTNFHSFSEPFADISSIPTLFLSKFAKEDVTVALSGDGGDELFWGYLRNYNISKKIDWIGSSKLRIGLRILYEKILFQDRKVSSKELIYNNFVDYYYHSLFIPGAVHWTPKIINSDSRVSTFYPSFNNSIEYLNVMRKMEFDLHLQRILIKVDRASMYNSLEVRVPLLANSVIDKSTEFSFNDCVNNNAGKLPLREILGRYVNSSIVNNKKQGFMIPIDDWLRTALRDDIHSKLSSIPNELSIYLNQYEINQMLQQHFSGNYSWGWMIWSLYSLVNWYEYHVNKIVL